ncbi:MAG: hypothetical protein QMC70_06700 [Bacteroidia bacterium]|jgi:hypothetical protein|tara:strand:+ start:135 stop:326 length:192 start_codon:yes stop_codon:yes gene_type:complete
MNIALYIVGFILFGSYCGFMVWSISYGNRKQNETNNYANLSDPVDKDGMGKVRRLPDDTEGEK